MSNPPRLCRRAVVRGVIAACVVAGLAASGCGVVAGAGSTEAASVNGQRITESDVNSELSAIGANAAYTAAIEQQQPVRGKGKGTFDPAFVNQVLSRQILLAIIHQEVATRNLHITADNIKTAAADQRNQIGKDPKDQQNPQGKFIWDAFSKPYQDLLARRAAEVTAVQDSLVPVDDAAIQTFYDANKAKLAQNCASHILVATQAKADDLHRQLVGGADFATLAKANSTDTGSATKGGDLGCAPPGSYVPEFEAALATLTVNQVSPVIHTKFGYHIIKLTSRKEGLADVRPQIVSQLHKQGSQELSRLVQANVQKAKIDVARRYGTFDKSSGSITAPGATSTSGGPPTSTSGGPPTSIHGAPPTSIHGAPVTSAP